jgi:hypothetical protein
LKRNLVELRWLLESGHFWLRPARIGSVTLKSNHPSNIAINMRRVLTRMIAG